MALRPEISDAIAEAARTISSSADLDETLAAIVRAAAGCLPGIDHVSVSLVHRTGSVTTQASTDDLVRELDQVQYDLGEGPCLSALSDAPLVTAADLVRESRWPSYRPVAVARGVRAQGGVRLYVDGETFGGLNLYATERGVFAGDVTQAAQLFGALASGALSQALRERDLTRALQTRKVIGQALGILMERYQLDEARALQYLTRLSQHSNVKLRAVAAELVDQRNTGSGQ